MKHVEVFNLNNKPLYSVVRRISTAQDAFKETFHAHQGMEWQYIHEGSGKLLIDQRSVDIVPGTLCFFQPFQLHRLQMHIDSQTRYVRSFVLFEPAFFEPYLEGFPGLQIFFRSLYQTQLQSAVIYNIEERHEFVRLLTTGSEEMAAIQLQDRRREEYALYLLSLLRLLRPLVTENNGMPPLNPRPVHRTEHIMQWVERKYTEPFRLAALANDLHMSPYYVSHLFQETTGSSISEYVKARRIRQACVLLTISNRSVAEIGEAIGLDNTSYFCKVFKQEKGMTPHQYRLQWKSKQ